MIELSLPEKNLYHQIHPLKLLTDWLTGIIALFLFWGHALIPGLVVAIIPSILVSFLLLRKANLEPLRRSPFGSYIQKYMTRTAQFFRLAGYAVMALGAWYHQVSVILIGLLVILLAWSWGWILAKIGMASDV